MGEENFILAGAQTEGTTQPPVPDGPYLRPQDWLSFGLTAGLALAVYLVTMAPEVTLEMSGVLATAAKYGGAAHPPGFPLWTLYAWTFTQILPFSNIAWRVGVSNAVAGALTCGMIALLVSRGGAAILEGIARFPRLAPMDERWLFVASGCAAGLGFGFSNP